MKLKSKLIPLAVVATAASAIVPMTVACSSENVKVDDINSVEAAMPQSFLPQYSTPSFPKNEDASLTERDWATNEYISLVKKNPQYFVDDLRWGVYQNFLSAYNNSNFQSTVRVDDEDFSIEPYTYRKFESNIKSLKFGASTPTFSTVNIVYPGQGQKQKHQYNTVSFKMRIEYEVEVNTYEYEDITAYDWPAEGRYISESAKHAKTIKVSTDVEYKNMIFYAMQAARDNKLEIDQMIGYSNSLPFEKYNVTSLAQHPEVETEKPGWFITISDFRDSQEAYGLNFTDWGIKYDSNIQIDDVITTSGQQGEKVTNQKETYHLADNVNSLVKLNNMVNKKSYTGSSDYKYQTKYTNIEIGQFKYKDDNLNRDYNNFWAWFSQNPEQIVANCVLMDTVSYFFSNTYNTPSATAVSDGGMYNSYYKTRRNISSVRDFTREIDTSNAFLDNGWAFVDSQAFLEEDAKYKLDGDDAINVLIPASGIDLEPTFYSINSADSISNYLLDYCVNPDQKNQIEAYLGNKYVPSKKLTCPYYSSQEVDGLKGYWYVLPLRFVKQPEQSVVSNDVDKRPIKTLRFADNIGGNILFVTDMYYNNDGDASAMNATKQIMSLIQVDGNQEKVRNVLSYFDMFDENAEVGTNYRSIQFGLPEGSLIQYKYTYTEMIDDVPVVEHGVKYDQTPSRLLEVRYFDSQVDFRKGGLQ